MRKPIIAGNWKMNKNSQEAIEMIKSLKEMVAGVDEVEIVVVPPYTSLSAVSNEIVDTKIELGAQNVHFEKSGAYTGEVSAAMIKEVGCKWVIIGHSERRQYFQCTNEMVNKKIKAAVAEGLKPIVCIGETLEERETGKTFEVLEVQIKDGLKGLSQDEQDNLTIAYEPVWAIGTGKTATPEQAEEVHKFIREKLAGMYGEEFAQAVRILYGGSVKPSNVADLMSQENLDGGLVGGASLEADSFASLVKFNK